MQDKETKDNKTKVYHCAAWLGKTTRKDFLASFQDYGITTDTAPSTLLLLLTVGAKKLT